MKNFSLMAVFSLCWLFSYSQTPLFNLDQIMAALKSGKNVKTIINYGKCELYHEGIKAEKSPEAIGGMRLDTYEYFDSSVFKGKQPSFLSTSQTVLISHPFYGYVYNYVKMKIRTDGTVDITARYLKPKKLSSKFKVVMDETFKGLISTEKGEGSISFFAD